MFHRNNLSKGLFLTYDHTNIHAELGSEATRTEITIIDANLFCLNIFKKFLRDYVSHDTGDLFKNVDLKQSIFVYITHCYVK